MKLIAVLLLGPVFTTPSAPSALHAQEADLPSPHLAQMPRTLRWGPQRPNLVRYNRVEGPSLGVRGQIWPQTFFAPLSLTGTANIGIADLEPNWHFDITREMVKRRVTFSLFHELAAIDEDARHLWLSNSLLPVFTGRDDGDYYRRSGASFEWTPPELERRDLKVRGFAEYHRPAVAQTDFAVFKLGSDAFRFRDDLVADEGWVYRGQVAITPWWGSDPNLVPGGLELTAEAATGDFEYTRTTLVSGLAVPLPSDLRLGLQAGAVEEWGNPTEQRMWHLGGPSSLRGYDPRRLTGTSFVRAGGELARAYSFASVSLFVDVGWAGSPRAAAPRMRCTRPASAERWWTASSGWTRRGASGGRARSARTWTSTRLHRPHENP